MTKLRNSFEKLIEKTIIALLSVLIACIISEVILDNLDYPYVGCRHGGDQVEEGRFGHFDPETGWSYNNNASYYSDNVSYHLDSHGFRVADPFHKIDFSKPRMLFIGDSITFGYGITYEDTFAAKINGLTGNKFEVVNVGVQGYGTDQTFEKLYAVIEEVKPSVIIYTFIPDHLLRNINYDRRQIFKCVAFPGTKPLYSIRDKQLLRVLSPIEISEYDRFRLPVLLRNAYDKIRMDSIKKSGSDIIVTKGLLSNIENTGEKNGASVFYIYYDNKTDTSSNSSNNKLLKELFLSSGYKVLPFFDWATDPKGDYYPSVSNYHPNGKVTSIMSERFITLFGSDLNGIAEHFREATATPQITQ